MSEYKPLYDHWEFDNMLSECHNVGALQIHIGNRYWSMNQHRWVRLYQYRFGAPPDWPRTHIIRHNWNTRDGATYTVWINREGEVYLQPVNAESFVV